MVDLKTALLLINFWTAFIFIALEMKMKMASVLGVFMWIGAAVIWAMVVVN